jgi:hypothetical protein
MPEHTGRRAGIAVGVERVNVVVLRDDKDDVVCALAGD